MALTTPNSKHIPYRNSKLTLILKESLGGSAKTTLLCTASRLSKHEEESIQTLYFASRAKFIKNVCKVNFTFEKKELQYIAEHLKLEIMTLRGQLKKAGIPWNKIKDPKLLAFISNDCEDIGGEVENEKEVFRKRKASLIGLSEDDIILKDVDLRNKYDALLENTQDKVYQFEIAPTQSSSTLELKNDKEKNEEIEQFYQIFDTERTTINVKPIDTTEQLTKIEGEKSQYEENVNIFKGDKLKQTVSELEKDIQYLDNPDEEKDSNENKINIIKINNEVSDEENIEFENSINQENNNAEDINHLADNDFKLKNDSSKNNLKESDVELEEKNKNSKNAQQNNNKNEEKNSDSVQQIIEKEKLNIKEKNEQLNEMEMSEEIVEGKEKCIGYMLDKKIFITMKGYYVRFYNIRVNKKTFSLNCAVKGCHGSGTFLIKTQDFIGKCNHNLSHNRHLLYNNKKIDLIMSLTRKQNLIKDAVRNKIKDGEVYNVDDLVTYIDALNIAEKPTISSVIDDMINSNTLIQTRYVSINKKKCRRKRKYFELEYALQNESNKESHHKEMKLK